MSKQRPNIIIFFTDQQRFDTCGIHGNPMNLTPNFDRMAMTGTHFYNAFSVQPICGPARSVLQTGLYATETGCTRNGIPLPKQSKTLAHYLKETDYQTAYIGKWHLASGDPVPEDEQGGYDYWLGANVLEFASESYDCNLFDKEGNTVKLPGYRVDAMADAAVRYIFDAQQQQDPFFLFLSFCEPHHDNMRDCYPAPIGYEEECAKNCWFPPDLRALAGSAPEHLPGYYGMIRRLDEALGRIQDTLKSLDMEENTILLFTSDHGCHFKTRNKEYKRSCHESSIRIPLAAAGGIFSSGSRKKELVSLADIAPTILSAAGIDIPEEMRGESTLRLINKEGEQWQNEIFIQLSEAELGRAIRTNRWKYGVAAPEKDPWKESFSDTYEETYLYDLRSDPWEQVNLSGMKSHREVSDHLQERLIKRINVIEGRTAEIVNARERKSGQRRVFEEEIKQ